MRAQRSDLTGLSFFCEESAKPRRIELSKLINRLKGKWKIADNAKATHFIIVDQDIYKGRRDKIPSLYLGIIQDIQRKAEDHLRNAHLKSEFNCKEESFGVAGHTSQNYPESDRRPGS